MKLSTNRVVGIIAVVLAIAAAVFLGQLRKEHFLAKEPTELLPVEYRQWICDEAELLDHATEQVVTQYNTAWDEKYYAVVAVATVERLNGWDGEDYAAALGQKWGLGENDMILVLVENGDWQVYMGDYVGAVMQDYQQQKLRQALDETYYDGDFDGAVTAFFRQADVFYGQVDPAHKSGWSSGGDWYAPVDHGKEAGGGIVGVIFLVLMIFVVWVLFDRVRYTRYRRRYIIPGIVAPVRYYPIFWGRSLYRPARPRPAAPPPPVGGGYQSRPNQSRPMNNRPTGGFNGGGFSGGRRSGSSVRRSSGGGRSSRGGFGGGGFRGGRR
ncbi:MAG: TPM domain-containing protein [Oscillospiraceae bacterium]|nr:TPM domain-containing protein [Oscillospiraceae bacterium]